MKLIRPTTLTDAMLTSSTAPENDYAVWAAGTAYAVGARVILPSTHRKYEALAASTGVNPATDPTKWLDLALAFLAAAGMKLTSQPPMVEEFELVGAGQWFRYFVGALELIGALALLTPRHFRVGALALLLVDAGAFFAQLLILHGDIIHTLVIGALIGAVLYLSKGEPALSAAS